MIEAIRKHIAERVKKRRRECGLTQQQMGAGLGISFQQYQKYEWARNRIGADRLYLIAKTLGVNPAWFYEGLEPAGPPVDDIAARIRSLDGRGRIAICNLLNALEKQGPQERGDTG